MIDPWPVARERVPIVEVNRSCGDDVVAETDVTEQIRICTGLRQDGDEDRCAGDAKKQPDVLWGDRAHRFRASKHSTRTAPAGCRLAGSATEAATSLREDQDCLPSTITVMERARKLNVDAVRRRVANWRWPRSVRQARAHAILAAIVLWVSAIVTLTAGSGNRSIAGPLKGADFVQYYTIGSLARTHHGASLYNFSELHSAQVALVPESGPELYLPVYPPQAALLFAPLTVFPYRVALLIWTTVTIALLAVVVYTVCRSLGWTSSDPVFVAAAAAAFPPFWSLILHGQCTIVILLGFWAGSLALERQRPFLAGMAFGLILLKPQFAIVLVLTTLLCGEWALIAGALVSIAIQISCVGLLLGWQVLKEYAAFLPFMLKNTDLLEPKPFQTHSLSTLTHLMPTWIGLPLWIAATAALVLCTVKVWKSEASNQVRLGVLMIGSLLANPHLIIYDVTILVLPLLWIGVDVLEHGGPDGAQRFLKMTYWLFVTLLAPTAFAIKLQVSVLLMTWMFASSVLSVLRQTPSYKADPVPLTAAIS